MKNPFYIILILLSIAVGFFYIKPTYAKIEAAKNELKIYNDTLEQAEELKIKIDALESKIEGIEKTDRENLEKMLPDSINSVLLINEIDGLARESGFSISNISLQSKDDKASPRDVLYDSIDFSFNVSTSYDSFVNFLESVEKSLRLSDIMSVSFSPGENQQYDFDVTLRTYWLK